VAGEIRREMKRRAEEIIDSCRAAWNSLLAGNPSHLLAVLLSLVPMSIIHQTSFTFILAKPPFDSPVKWVSAA